MKRVLCVFVIIFCLIILSKQSVSASELSPNNKFGISMAQPHLEDLQKIHDLVNSNGGDWGYVTLIIQENDRNKAKWQEIFDQLRELHLVPIIRLATQPDGENWKRPQKGDADSWVEFLNSLHWVVKNRYIILFNEPNHGSEWGGEVDAVNYAEVAQLFAEKLKQKNGDFFIMFAGLDASAPSYGSALLDEESFLNTAVNHINKDNFNKLFSGLSSHSYPNPGFAGSSNGFGKGSVRTYQWEVQYLQGLGVKNLPVFITETGWSADKIARNQIAYNFQNVYESVWLPDESVVAVTPFVYDYQGEPFLNFSWKLFQSEDFYQQYYTVQAMTKVKGSPEQIEKGDIQAQLSHELVVRSSYRYHIELHNTGQAEWNKESGYSLRLDGLPTENYFFGDIGTINPFQTSDVDLYIKTGDKPRKYSGKLSLYKDERKILEGHPFSFEVVPLPKLNINISLYPKLNFGAQDFEVQIFDSQEGLIFKKSGISLTEKGGSVGEVQNIALDKTYRIVVLKPYYLPRQALVQFKRGENIVKFKRMFPLDFNFNGKLDIGDIWAFITHPRLLKLFFP